MGRWDYKVKNISGSPVEMTNALAGEQVKDIKDANEGTGMLKSTRSEDGRPQDLTIYNLSEILQGTPAFAGVGNTLGVLQTTLDIGLSNLSKAIGAADFLLLDMIPDDVRDFVDATRDAITGEGSSGATSGTALAAQSAQDILNNPRIDLGPEVRRDLAAGKIAPSIMAFVKLLSDSVPIHWWSGYRAKDSIAGPRVSDHTKMPARAADIRPIPGSSNLQGKYDDWTRKVYSIVESVTGDQRPYQVLGPVVTAFDGKTDPNGTWWKMNSDHRDHIHIGMKTAELLAPAPAAGGATGSTGSSQTGSPIAAGPPATRSQHGVRVPSPSQQAIIAEIVKWGQQLCAGAPDLHQVLVAAIESGWVESTMTNLNHGDGTSVGIFQLIDIHGSVADRMNIEFCCKWWFGYANSKHTTYSGANKDIPPPIFVRNGKDSAGALAQSVERSAGTFPVARAKYDKWRNQAVADLARIGIDASSVDP